MKDTIIIKEVFKNYMIISDQLSDEISKISELRKYKKNEVIYKSGIVSTSVSIIKHGLVRSYIESDNKEITIWFGEEGDFITSFYSFFTGKKGVETIDCIEDTVVLSISSEDFKHLIKENIEMLRLYTVILEKGYIYWEQRYAINQIYESEQRHSLFYHRSKEMVLKLPLKVLSSYLNIRQETLSRIRKRWLKS